MYTNIINSITLCYANINLVGCFILHLKLFVYNNNSYYDISDTNTYKQYI